MSKKTRVKFVVTFDRPPGVTDEQLAAYVEDAVATYCKSFPPPATMRSRATRSSTRTATPSGSPPPDKIFVSHPYARGIPGGPITHEEDRRC